MSAAVDPTVNAMVENVHIRLNSYSNRIFLREDLRVVLISNNQAEGHHPSPATKMQQLAC